MAMGQKRKGGGCLTMTSLALVCPYSDVAKSHVCQKEMKGCQKEMTGRKPALLPGPSMWDVMHAVTCTCITYHTEEDTSDCELHRSEPEPNCELHVARFSAVEIWLRSHRRFTTGHRRWRIQSGLYSFACIHCKQRESKIIHLLYVPTYPIPSINVVEHYNSASVKVQIWTIIHWF